MFRTSCRNSVICVQKIIICFFLFTGAMVIFKFTKPKVVNYEVIHYPQHHVEHHVDHHAPGWDAHGPYQARNFDDAHEMAYSAQI